MKNNGLLAPAFNAEGGLRPQVTIVGELLRTFPKGENGWQVPAGLYDTGLGQLGVGAFQLQEGDPASSNNICDLDRLVLTMTHVTNAFRVNNYSVPHVAIGVKHGNACGASFDLNYEDQVGTLRNMFSGDPLAIFGGTTMTNFTIGGDHVEAFFNGEGKVILDGIAAPDFLSSAIARLKRKNGKCRFLSNLALGYEYQPLDETPRIRPVRDGFILQRNYTNLLAINHKDLVKHGEEPTPNQIHDMLFAWAICATSNSNTITLVKDRKLIGNGVGQQARIYAAEIAVSRAKRHGHDINGAVAVSDSFFPVNDAVEHLVDAGVKMILTTSGSINDQKVIDFCRERNIILWMIPDAVGRMFFGH